MSRQDPRARAPDRLELVLDGAHLEPAEIAQVARRPGTVRVRSSDEAVRRMAESTTLRRRLIDRGQPIYGVTTGFGDSCTRQISAAKANELQRNLIRYHLNGVGPHSEPEVVRATLLIRANCLARGVSGVRAEVVEFLLSMLKHDILPVVPERGSVGASGDLVPLCYLSTVVLGDGEVDHRGRRRPAAEVLRECGLRPLELEAKEALALINGTSYMAAFAALALADAEQLAFVADLCTALTAQVLCGDASHFDAFLTDHKPHPGQHTSAALVNRLLSGSGLATDHVHPDADHPDLGDRGFQRLSRRLQDRYSVRCAPHVVGVLRDTVDWVRDWIRVEVNSATDNPLFDVSAGVVRNGGNFYGGHVAQAMDSLKTAVASTADLLDRQLALVVDEKFNNGLPPNLVWAVRENDHEAGLHHGYKGVQIACSALAAEALKMAGPAGVFSRSTEAHNQDKVSMGTIAARDATTIVNLTQNVAAMHLHALCQAADLRDPERLSPATARVHTLIRTRTTPMKHDRRLDGELATLVEMVQSGALHTAAESCTEGVPPDARPEPEWDYDAVVIGGGPAGSTAATELARRGHRVLVLERERFPRFHIGESLLTYTAALLRRMGVEPELAAQEFPVKRGAEFTDADGGFRRVDFTAQGDGRVLTTYQVERAEFDTILLRHAAATGATVHEEATVRQVCTDHTGRITGVEYRRDGRQHRVRSGFVIDASGRAGVVAHQHLNARVMSDRVRKVALYRHFGGVNEEHNPGVVGDIQIGNHPEGWVWAIPVRADKLSVGVVTDPETVRRLGPQRVFADHVARIPRITARLTDAVPITDTQGDRDFCYFTDSLAGPGFYVVGDAGCFVDPIFSGGVDLAMISGRKAAELICDHLADTITEEEAASHYTRFYKTGYDCYFRLILAFYESGCTIGPYLRSTGVQVDPRWLARLLAGDFWSGKNPLAEHLRQVERYRTFAPYEPLYGCPVYPDLDAHESASTVLGPPLAGAAR